MVATPEMEVASGGKKAEINDTGHLVMAGGLGSSEEWSGKFMFPKAGNPDGFVRDLPDWGTIFNLHASMTTDVLRMGIDTSKAPTIFFSRSGPTAQKQLARRKIVYDKWYGWRAVIKWSTGSDGRLQWWLDGQRLVDWSGPTILAGDSVYLQFGFYDAAQLRNEVWHAGLKVIELG
jgi:hypothetical protein